MGKFLVKRIISILPTIFIASTLVFILMRMMPVDPIRLLVPEDATEEQIEKERAREGLDKPVIVQYGKYMLGVVTGDWGDSFFTRRPVFTEIMSVIEPTILLTIYSTLITIVVAIPAGIFAATHRNSLADYLISGSSILFDAIPDFFLGLMFIYVFAFVVQWFPLTGYKLIKHYGIGQSLWSLTMPAFAMGLSHVAKIARQTRSQMLNQLNQDYVRTARAKGLSEKMVNYKHALKNTLALIVTQVAASFSGMLGGSIIIENVFNIDGLGRMAKDALSSADYNLEQAVVLYSMIITACVNIMLDIVYKKLDPRIDF